MILGLDIITLSLPIAISGTILHQIRTNYGTPLPKILDSILLTLGGSFVAAHTVLSEFTITDPFQQVLLIFSMVGVTIPGDALGQKVTQKVKQKVSSTSTIQNTRKEKMKKQYYDNHADKIIQRKLSPPELSPANSWYQTNFKKSEKGNTLNFGDLYLWIKLIGARTYVAAALYDEKMRALQIDQSTIHDEDNDIETIRLELITADGKPFPRGVCYVRPNGDVGPGDSHGVLDKFEII